VEEEKISMGHARALLAVESQDVQNELAIEIRSKNLSVREVERLVKIRQSVASSKNENAVVAEGKEEDRANVEAAEASVSKRLGAKVKIKFQKVGGSMEIKFASREDLARLFDILIQNTRAEGL